MSHLVERFSYVDQQLMHRFTCVIVFSYRSHCGFSPKKSCVDNFRRQNSENFEDKPSIRWTVANVNFDKF